MKILVINAGSSTLKFQIISMPDRKALCSGMVERIGSENAKLHYQKSDDSMDDELSIENHHAALNAILDKLMDKKVGTISTADEIDIVAHRVVHGGHVFNKPILINEEVKNIIKDFEMFAPLHNPKNLEGIELCESSFPTARQIAVFDTSFHTTIPEYAKQYALPSLLTSFDDVTKCGFHGISHQYVSRMAIEQFDLDNSKIVSLHLGSGCSAAAIVDGKSIDTSMGISTGGGLIMGTRSGDIDHGIIFYLVNQMNYNISEVEDLLNNESGLLGLTGYEDYRDVFEAYQRGDESCKLAMEMVVYRIVQYVGAYTASMNGLDAIIFTAGIGENAVQLREEVCRQLSYLDVKIDKALNKDSEKSARIISTADSKVKVIVVPTNEAFEIAQEAWDLITHG